MWSTMRTACLADQWRHLVGGSNTKWTKMRPAQSSSLHLQSRYGRQCLGTYTVPADMARVEGCVISRSGGQGVGRQGVLKVEKSCDPVLPPPISEVRGTMEPTSLTFTIFASPRWDRFRKIKCLESLKIRGWGRGLWVGTGNTGICKTESGALLKGKGQC